MSDENRTLYSLSYENYVSSLKKEFGDSVSIHHLPPSETTDFSKLIMTKEKIFMIQETEDEQKFYVEKDYRR